MKAIAIEAFRAKAKILTITVNAPTFANTTAKTKKITNNQNIINSQKLVKSYLGQSLGQVMSYLSEREIFFLRGRCPANSYRNTITASAVDTAP